ncbi:hypothetical protein PRIPAC_95136, partial [Pristionchus pacificus]|uniref:Uncharacterized protein n=1 Tax=Pristionchus pacificus TaxID=54126 RepID=A0A2A6CGY5_PRIPA
PQSMQLVSISSILSTGVSDCPFKSYLCTNTNYTLITAAPNAAQLVLAIHPEHEQMRKKRRE